jgi:hypothetical protein
MRLSEKCYKFYSQWTLGGRDSGFTRICARELQVIGEHGKICGGFHQKVG